MRISSTQLYTQGINAFGTQQTKISLLQQQISTGVRITKPSDDPAAASRVLELEQSISENEQYNINITLAENRLRLQETTLSAVENAFFRIKELTIQANGIANDQTALKSIAVEIEERYNELISIANTKDSSGDYLFAGYQNTTQPFSEVLTGAINHVQFSGDQGQRSIQVSPTRQVIADNSGSEVFLEVPSTHALRESANPANTGNGIIAPSVVVDASVYNPSTYQIVFTGAATYDVIDTAGPTTIVSGASYTDSAAIEFNGIRTSITGTPAIGDVFEVSQGQYRDIFTTVNGIVDTLNNPLTTPTQRNANLAQAQIDMENFFTNVLEVRTSIGGRLNSLQTQLDDNEAFIITTKKTMSTLRDTDLAEAISQLTLEQTTLDAAQAVFARIASSSLFNFLR